VKVNAAALAAVVTITVQAEISTAAEAVLALVLPLTIATIAPIAVNAMTRDVPVGIAVAELPAAEEIASPPCSMRMNATSALSLCSNLLLVSDPRSWLNSLKRSAPLRMLKLLRTVSASDPKGMSLPVLLIIRY
jgi:hypothetical protein